MKPSSLLVAGLLCVANLVEGIRSPTASVSLPGKKDHVDDGTGRISDRDSLGTPRRRLLPLSVPGLIHLYTGDSSNANDAVGSAAGELGANTKFTAGRNGLGFDFDGTAAAMVTLPVDINSNIFPKLTMGFFVKLRTVGTSTNSWALTHHNGNFDRGIILDDDDFIGVVAGIGSQYTSNLPRITANEWHCVAVAYDDSANVARVYYDGLTETKNTSLGAGRPELSLGGTATRQTDYVDGQIDEVFMFDRYLTKSQIDTVCEELLDSDRGPPPTLDECDGINLFGLCVCFSGDSLVRVKDTGLIRMDQLRIGDEVLTAGGTYSKVYSFGHFAPKTKMEYLQVQTASMDKNQALEISSEHLIYIQDEEAKTFTRRLVSAGDLKVGDHLLTETGLSSAILSIRKVQREGAYAPLTTTGNILVNGVVASNYVTRGWLQKHNISGDTLHHLQHGATLPVRIFCSLTDCAEEIYDDINGLSPWVNFWFRIEQWLLALSPVAHVSVLVFLTAPAVLITLLGKVLSLPMGSKFIHLLVAFAGFIALKHNRRAKTLKPEKKDVRK